MFHILNIWALFMVKVAFMQYVFPFRYTQCVCVFFKITTQLMESWCRSRCLEVLPTPPLRPWRGSGGGGGRSEVVLSSTESSCWVWYAGTSELRPEERGCAAPPAAAATLRLLRAFIKPGGWLPEPLSSPPHHPHPAVQIYHLLLIATCASEALLHLLALLSVARSPILSSPGGEPGREVLPSGAANNPRQAALHQPRWVHAAASDGVGGGFHQRYYCCDVS